MDHVQGAPAQHGPESWVNAQGAVPVGTHILTLDGILPVEHLYPGDRIVTRRGTRRLAMLRRIELPAATDIIRVTPMALGGKPDCETWLLPHQKVLIRDWRAKAIWGADAICVTIQQLVDKGYVRRDQSGKKNALLQLGFDSAEVFYGNGLELAAAVVAPADVEGPA